MRDKSRNKVGSTDSPHLLTEKEYMGWIRDRMLREKGLAPEAYMGFVAKHLGWDYVSKTEPVRYEHTLENMYFGNRNGYMDGFCLQKYMAESWRNSSASVYTPEDVAGYLAVRGIFYACEEEFRTRGATGPGSKKFNSALGDMMLKGKTIRVIDISAGAGLLLLKMLSIMDGALAASGAAEPEIASILLRQVNDGFYVNDLHREGLEFFLLKLLDRFLGLYGYEDINPTIFCRDAVSDCEFGEPFDLVLGNPPYMGEKGNRKIFDKAKESSFGNRFYEAKMDYFYFFIYKAIEMLKPGGIVSYITTNYFTTADGGRNLRKYLRDQTCFREIFMLDDIDIFSDAKGQHNMMFVLQKEPCKTRITVQKIARGGFADFGEALALTGEKEIPAGSIYDSDGNIVLYENELHGEITGRIRGNAACTLGDAVNVRQGIVTGCDRTSRRNLPPNQPGMEPDEPIFVFSSPDEVPDSIRGSSLLKPFYKNSDICRYSLRDSKKQIIYVTDEALKKVGRGDAEAIIGHLERYREILSRRREVSKGSRKWYELQWYRDETIFNGPKLMVPHRAVENRFVYTDGPCYGSADIYFISGKNEKYMKALCCILNSKLAYFWLRNNGKRKGRQLELYHTPLSRIPIPDMTEAIVERLSACHDSGQMENRETEAYVCGLYGLNRADIEEIEKTAESDS